MWVDHIASRLTMRGIVQPHAGQALVCPAISLYVAMVEGVVHCVYRVILDAY